MERSSKPIISKELEQFHCSILLDEVKEKVRKLKAYGMDEAEIVAAAYFSGTNLMIIFPDQYGDQKEDRMSFTEAQHHEEDSIYDLLMRWIHRSSKSRSK